MEILQKLFDPATRQAKKLEGLRARHTELTAAHVAAVAAGDDSAQSKAWAALEKIGAEIREKEAALEAANRHARQVQADADRTARAALVAEVDRAQRAADAAALAWEQSMEAQARLVDELRAAFDTLRAARKAAGLPDESRVAGLTFVDVWGFALRALARTVDMQLPQVVKWSGPAETLEQRIARLSKPFDKAA